MKIVTRIGKFRAFQRRPGIAAGLPVERRTMTRRAVLELAKEAPLRLFLGVKRRRRTGVLILAVHHISRGNTDNPGTQLWAGPEHFTGLGVERHEMPIGAAAEHHPTGRCQRRA